MSSFPADALGNNTVSCGKGSREYSAPYIEVAGSYPPTLCQNCLKAAQGFQRPIENWALPIVILPRGWKEKNKTSHG